MIVCLAAMLFMDLTKWVVDWRKAETLKRPEFKVFNTQKPTQRVYWNECAIVNCSALHHCLVQTSCNVKPQKCHARFHRFKSSHNKL